MYVHTNLRIDMYLTYVTVTGLYVCVTCHDNVNKRWTMGGETSARPSELDAGVRVQIQIAVSPNCN